MRGCIFIISFFLGLCGYQTSPPSPWPPWPIMWNLSRNEYEDDANIQRVVYIHFNSTSDFLVHCRNPLVRYGYVDAQQIESKYQRKLCYNNDYSMICRRNKSLRTDSNWVTRALNDATNIRMVECLKPLFLNKMSHSLILRRYKRSMINGSETVFKENASMTLPPIPSAQKHATNSSAIGVTAAAPGHPVTTTAGKLLVTTIPSWRVAQPTAKAVGSNSTSTKKSKTRAPKGKSKRTRKKPSKTTKAMAYIPEPEPWGSGKLVDDYYEANHEHEERKKPNTLFAAVLLSLVIANMIFVVLLVICLMLYLKVKRLEVMRPHGREAKFARRSRSKPSSRQKKSMSSAGAEGDDPLRRNGEKRTQSQMSSLQDQADKSAKNRNGANIDAAAAAASPNAATPEAVEFTGIPLTIKNPTPKMGYQDHLNAPPPKAPSRNVPVTALPDNAPVNAMAPNSPVNPVHHNPVAASPTVGPAQRNVPASPARNAPTRSITGAPATVNTQQQKFNVPQNRMKQSIDVPVRQPIRGVSPGVGPRNVQSVTLM